MKIICKTTLLPPPFVGTRIRIRLDDPASLTWGINSIGPASGHEKVIIEWGDGAQDEITAQGQFTHTYAHTGEYEVRISDDVSQIRISARSETDPCHTTYAPMIREVKTNATNLITLLAFCFANASCLQLFNCAESAVKNLNASTFKGCSSLSGSIDLRGINGLGSTSFGECLAVTELVFSQANYDIISALSGFDTQFGALNATISFV